MVLAGTLTACQGAPIVIDLDGDSDGASGTGIESDSGSGPGGSGAGTGSGPGSSTSGGDGPDTDSAASESAGEDTVTDSGAGTMGESGSGGETGDGCTPEEAPCGDCDVWVQDCPDGTKCTAYEEPPHDDWTWDRNGCFPVDPSPRGRGEPCVVQDNPASGLDNCELGAICLFVDDRTLEGMCVEFCVGPSSSASCNHPWDVCYYFGDGVIPLCLPMCDPLAQDCGDGNGCYEDGGGGFICFEQDSAAMGEPSDYGAPCGSLNFCDPGLQCAAAANIVECTFSYCCTAWCDFTLPNDCPDADAGQECVPYYDSSSPPGLETVGICAIPEP